MTLSEFTRAVDAEFGRSRARVLCADLVLGALGSVTADEAIEAGVDPRRVWLALCEAVDVPPERRHGAGRPEPRP
ncbi:DUF3046 domain-containing protein [Mycetocola reblochoni]|uniref:Signal transduction histidine kinase n=2 Tax=Mycetocola reblochoni TaxID=331618 RepID=A0A1R4IFA2_9MICO|nr:DUF3046 domain-containing protein [Mycetocola reblochoni]RLP68117.1 DUF3046 domain-containing protein [Mycetocola reblochoni]SJN18234.1 hypothetical protein FM119_01375 [Mycetocola reblochoni REB411]